MKELSRSLLLADAGQQKKEDTYLARSSGMHPLFECGRRDYNLY